MAGFFAIVLTRIKGPKKLSVMVLSIVHGVAGLTISFLPIYLAAKTTVPGGFALVSIGGMMIGTGGLLLSFSKMGIPILTEDRFPGLFPGLLMLTILAFVVGFSFI